MSQNALGLSEAHDLRSGRVPWQEGDWQIPAAADFPSGSLDIAILGAGIMGAILADRLSRDGRKVGLFDRRPPGCGSTAASTAQIMWAMDVPLLELAATQGRDEAARRWRRVHEAVQRFGERLDRLGANARRICPTLYLSGDMLDAERLQQEAELHLRNGLPSRFLNAREVAERFGIAPRAGVVSQGSYAIDPVRICHELLDEARGRGAVIAYPTDIIALHPAPDGVEIEAQDGKSVLAREVIVATGYERTPMFLPPEFSLLSTFAIATPSQTAPLWRESAMIWEASDPYLYVREGAQGRIIAGGEDVDLFEAGARDALLEKSSGRIAARLEAMLGTGPVTIDRAWAATFGASPDGLPAIGRSSLMEHVWLAAGYGGNGIAFAALAAEILSREIGGEKDPDAECFNPYRFGA